MIIMLFFTLCSICGAASQQSEISLGGVRLGMSYQDVISMFGEPSIINDSFNAEGNLSSRYIEYGNNVQITFDYNYKTKELEGVTNVFVIANNGWKLPSGIRVGSKFREVFDHYGKGALHGKGMYGDYWLFKSNDAYTIIVTVERVIYDINTIKDTDVITSLQISRNSFSENDFYSHEEHKKISNNTGQTSNTTVQKVINADVVDSEIKRLADDEYSGEVIAKEGFSADKPDMVKVRQDTKDPQKIVVSFVKPGDVIITKMGIDLNGGKKIYKNRYHIIQNPLAGVNGLPERYACKIINVERLHNDIPLLNTTSELMQIAKGRLNEYLSNREGTTDTLARLSGTEYKEFFIDSPMSTLEIRNKIAGNNPQDVLLNPTYNKIAAACYVDQARRKVKYYVIMTK